MYVHDVAISYTQRDQELANLVFDILSRLGLSVFTVRIERNLSERGAELVRANLKASRWVLLLASEHACKFFGAHFKSVSPALDGVELISIIWDVEVSALPSWIDREFVLDIQGVTVAQFQRRVAELARKLGANQSDAVLIFSAVLMGLMCRSVGDDAT